MYDYLIHANNGSGSADQPVIIGGHDDLAEAREIAAKAAEEYPEHTVTIIDRWDCEHSLRPIGRPQKADADRAVRINISLSPDTIAALDALGGTRSGTISRLIHSEAGDAA